MTQTVLYMSEGNLVVAVKLIILTNLNQWLFSIKKLIKLLNYA